MFSFCIKNETKYTYRSGTVHAIVNSKTQAKQLVTDLLLCVIQEQVKQLITLQFGLNKEVFEEGLLFNTSFKCFIRYPIENVSFYNYNYPKVDEENTVIFIYTS